MKNFLKIASIASIVLSVTVLSACNTVHGFGQDLQNLGSAIDKSGNKSADKKSDSNTSSGDSGVVVTPVK